MSGWGPSTLGPEMTTEMVMASLTGAQLPKQSKAASEAGAFQPTTRRKSVRQLIPILAGLLMISFNVAGKSIDVAEWTEEVKLSDGRMVTVWRKARAYSGGFPNSKRGRNIDFEFRYEPLGLWWVATMSEKFVRDPVSFDIIDGVPYLVLHMGDREGCRNRPKSDYTAQFLRWVNDRWVEVPQAQFPVDRALMNLSGDYWGHTVNDDYRGLIRWDSKRLRGGTRHATPDTIQSYFDRGHRVCERLQK